jgi:hypothetical protein
VPFTCLDGPNPEGALNLRFNRKAAGKAVASISAAVVITVGGLKIKDTLLDVVKNI